MLHFPFNAVIATRPSTLLNDYASLKNKVNLTHTHTSRCSIPNLRWSGSGTAKDRQTDYTVAMNNS